MKKLLPWLITAAAIGLAVGAFWQGQDKQGSGVSIPIVASGQGAPANVQAAAPEGEVVYTFEDQAKMLEFANIWQMRQAMVMRMASLQAYWNGEQASLAEIDEKLSAEYGVQTEKNYFADGAKRVLVEREFPPETEGEEAAGSSEVEEKVVHTFADDEEIRAFAELSRQRQAIVLRQTVLQTYWNQEQTRLAEMNTQLASTYGLDTDKNYFLDGQRRVLVEQEAPPAPESTVPITDPTDP